jgi:hypothetical protein
MRAGLDTGSRLSMHRLLGQRGASRRVSFHAAASLYRSIT